MEEKEVEEVEWMMGRIEKLSSISVDEWEVLYDRIYELEDGAAGRPEEIAFLLKAKKELRKFRRHDVRDTERVRELQR